jgi:hypothetical protein
VTRHVPVALVAVFIAALAVAACTPQASPSPAAPSPVVEAAPAGPVLGCLSIEQAECEFVANQALAVLPAARGVPFAIIVNLGGCPIDGPCRRSLEVRKGMITAEYVDGGEPTRLSVTGPPQSPRFGEDKTAWSGLLQPSSPRISGVGPFPFDLGHCGLSWQVDFDGSFWLPIGQIDGDAPEVINNDTGEMRLLGPNLAEYRNPGGFVAQLARFPGPKHGWLCM